MREKEIFSRSKETKVCDTPELVCLITEWTQKGNWKFEDFWTFLELVGINNPIRLYGLDESKCFWHFERKRDWDFAKR